jgi:hypothetical protein
MENNDSLARLSHAYGITDADLDERQAVLDQIAEEEELQELKKFSENEDIDWGYHDQYDF